MMSKLEFVLRELESATAAVAGVAVEDFAEAQAAMDRRSWAIADLAILAGDGLANLETDRDGTLTRLRRVLELGQLAAERLSASRGVAAVEWSQWSRIYSALGVAGSPKLNRIDCRG
jgi:hypothetical protein